MDNTLTEWPLSRLALPWPSGPRQWAPILPHIRTIYRWLEDNEEFRHQSTPAREIQGRLVLIWQFMRQ
jgi:hypothetical protein